MVIKNRKIQECFARLQSQNPAPVTELQYTSHYTLLIAVLLSAQTTDKQVNKCTPLLFSLADTPEKMATCSVEDIQRCINTIGLFRQKARHVHEASQQIVAHYGGKVPNTLEALTSLPGVGRKTANVVLNVAFGRFTIPVDTHVFRVSRRLGFSSGNTPLKVESDLMEVIPKSYQDYAHHWLILHGRYVCKAVRPLCDECILRDICPKNDVAIKEHKE
ncbi:MAG: endonuclease III [Alphaproteobacteria bacterium]|nr:endonuclease III [Alphaproteobacteria bacterium]